MAGLDGAIRLFHYAFAVVLLSLLIQGTSVAPMARLLRLEVPAPREPRLRAGLHLPTGHDYEILEFEVEVQSAADGANPARRRAGASCSARRPRCCRRATSPACSRPRTRTRGSASCSPPDPGRRARRRACSSATSC
jgi:hypothetical protein